MPLLAVKQEVMLQLLLHLIELKSVQLSSLLGVLATGLTVLELIGEHVTLGRQQLVGGLKVVVF
jgi:hypothetical protein